MDELTKEEFTEQLKQDGYHDELMKSDLEYAMTYCGLGMVLSKLEALETSLETNGIDMTQKEILEYIKEILNDL